MRHMIYLNGREQPVIIQFPEGLSDTETSEVGKIFTEVVKHYRPPEFTPCPTWEQCYALERLEFSLNGTATFGYAVVFHKINGYASRAVAMPTENSLHDAMDFFIWHDGEFPFDDDPSVGGLLNHEKMPVLIRGIDACSLRKLSRDMDKISDNIKSTQCSNANGSEEWNKNKD